MGKRKAIYIYKKERTQHTVFLSKTVSKRKCDYELFRLAFGESLTLDELSIKTGTSWE